MRVARTLSGEQEGYVSFSISLVRATGRSTICMYEPCLCVRNVGGRRSYFVFAWLAWRQCFRAHAELGRTLCMARSGLRRFAGFTGTPHRSELEQIAGVSVVNHSIYYALLSSDALCTLAARPRYCSTAALICICR